MIGRRLALLPLLASLGAPSTARAAMSFDEAVRAMLARDTEVGAVSAEAESASALALGKRYHFLPSVSLDGTRAWSKTYPMTTSLLGNASLPIFRFGADAAASDSASEHARAAEARVQKARLERETKAVAALLELIRATEARGIYGQLETMGKESVAIAERQYAGGRIANQEVQKVKIDLENTRFEKAEADQALVVARSAVESLLGSADVVAEFPWKARIEATRAPAPDPAEMLRLRPEWIEAEAESRSLRAVSRSAFRGMLPELDAKFGAGWVKDPYVSPDFEQTWTGSLTLTIPLFNAFRDYGAYRAAAETANAAESRLEGVKREVLAGVREVPSRYEIARKTALDREAILKSSERLYQDNLSRFRQGRASSDELNVDLNRYLKTQLGAISGWVAAHQAWVDLAHLRGACATACK